MNFIQLRYSTPRRRHIERVHILPNTSNNKHISFDEDKQELMMADLPDRKKNQHLSQGGGWYCHSTASELSPIILAS